MVLGGNSQGEIGDGTTTKRTLPTHVPGLSGVAALSAGHNTTCVTLTDGSAWCWGANQTGQLGIGTASAAPSPLPKKVIQAPAFSVIRAGGFHSCAVGASDASVRCWGRNDENQIGNPAGSSIAAVPRLVP